MFCKAYILSVALAVLVVFAKQSNGDDGAIMDCVEEFKDLLDKKEYMSIHGNAFKAIDKVNKAASESGQKVSGEDKKNAIEEARKGFENSIKCVAVSGYTVYKANNEVRDSTDVEGNKKKLREANENGKKTIGVAGLAAYSGVGSASELAEYAQQPLRKSNQKITFAGQISYSGLDVAERLGISGLDFEGVTKEQALNASSKAVEATGAACYIQLVESAKNAFQAIDGSKPASPEDRSVDNAAAKQSSQAESAIESVNKQAKSAEGSNKDAANVIKTGVISAIKGLAGALSKPKKYLKANENAISKETIKSIEKVLSQSEDDIAYAAAYAYQALGIAGQMVGGDKKSKILSVMSIVEAGRSSAYKAVEDARQLAVVGVENKDTAEKTGINAAIEALESGEYIGYKDLAKAAEMAFDVLKS